MSETRFFNRTKRTGITRLFHYNHDDDSYTISKTQDVKPILDANARAYNSVDERARWNHDELGMNRVASIPILLWFQWQKQGITQNWDTLRRKLSDSAFKRLRTRPGRLI